MNKKDYFELLGPNNLRALFMPEKRIRERDHADIQWRESGSGDGSPILIGYPAVFNQETTLFEGKRWVLKEKIMPGFFDECLENDVHFNLCHDMKTAMARTGIKGIGGLDLSSDSHGLRCYARLDPQDKDVQAITPKMQRGVMDQMSFAFSVAEQSYEVEEDEQGREVETWSLIRCRRLYDVCVCPQGAYSQTEAALRSLAEVITRQSSIELKDKDGVGAHALNPEVASKEDGAKVDNLLAKRQKLILVSRAKLVKLKYR